MIDARLAGHSGIGTYLAAILPRVLPALVAAQPRVLAGSAQRAALAAALPRGTPVDPWDVAPLSPRDLVAVPPALARDDVLWTPHFNVPLLHPGPLVVTLHDLLPLTAPALVGPARAGPLRAWLSAIRRRARAVLCVSEFTRAEALRLGRIPADRATVTHLAADEAWFAAATEAAATRAAHPNGSTPTIVSVGLMKPHKNHARLLRAFARLRERIPHRLVLVARRHGVRHLDREALELAHAMPDRVELVDSLPFADLVRVVARAEFVALPSLHEGFGLPALEAMAAGVPVLAGRAGALPEVCGEAAVYCDPQAEADIERALLALATDGELRHRLAAAGRERARSFSWDACARLTTQALFAALADAHR